MSGCSDALPTLSNGGGFATGTLPTTIEWLVDSDDALLGSAVIAGGTDKRNASFLLVANSFDGVLEAHTLSRFGLLSDTLDLVEGTDSILSFQESQVVAVVSDTLGTSDDLLDFELWTVTQEWDSTAVSWENAVDQPGAIVPWTEAGGTRGQRVAVTRWERADSTASGDSLVWTIPPAISRGIAKGEIPGLMVTLLQPDSRAQISSLTFRASIQPTVQNDTVLTRTLTSRPQNFIFTPEPPAPAGPLRVGGITSDRTHLRIDLSDLVPACAPVTDSCTNLVPLSEVSLNRFELLLDPVPVTSGFRILRPLVVNGRLLLEPELGDRSPLGPLAAADSLTVAEAQGSTGMPYSIDLAGAVALTLARKESVLAIALLVEPQASSFGYAWFDPNPRLRLIYTLPQQVELP